MSNPIDLKRLRELLANAPKYPEAAPRSDGIYTCPMCDGEASVEAVSATGVLMVGGIQCFGIGTDHQNLEALARAAVLALPALLDRLESAERTLETEKVRSAALEAALRELLKEYPDGHQQSRWEVTATKWDRARRLLAQAAPGDAGEKP